ncbi:MAG: alcohol dehydrogenase catalytic domain-containing protein [Firmicutes bacterium]|nr:alcohol dehydrogenase catalytic domain-containing protein [Bacillota bacterium]
MKAVVYPEPNKFEIRDVPVPEPRPEEVLIKVRATTICATDMKIFTGKFPGTRFPHIPGHEWGGDVVAVGKGVDGVKVGDRVGVEVHVGCGKCQPCINGMYNICENYGDIASGHQHIGFTVPGGLAEYCAVSIKAVHRLPPGLDYDEAAFTDNIGVALHAVERTGLRPGENIAVIGPGAFGQLAVQIARSMAAGKIAIVGTRAERLQMGLKLGADEAVNVSEVGDPVAAVKKCFDGKGPDVVVEFAGTESAAHLALSCARRGGRVTLAGATGPGRNLNIDLSVIVRGHLDVFGSVANPRWVSARGLRMIERGVVDVKPLITHHMSLAEFPTAWQMTHQREDGAIRVMLDP